MKIKINTIILFPLLNLSEVLSEVLKDYQSQKRFYCYAILFHYI